MANGLWPMLVWQQGSTTFAKLRVCHQILFLEVSISSFIQAYELRLLAVWWLAFGEWGLRLYVSLIFTYTLRLLILISSLKDFARWLFNMLLSGHQKQAEILLRDSLFFVCSLETYLLTSMRHCKCTRPNSGFTLIQMSNLFHG